MGLPTLPPEAYRDLVARALAEDVGGGDVTTRAIVPATARARGVFLAKEPCTIAGLPVAAEAFRQVDPAVTFAPLCDDGAACAPGTPIARVEGPAGALLEAERTALNFLQRLSGVATRTRAFVAAAAGRIAILDTRKTTPGYRALEKYAVRCGGGSNHRAGLFDGVLIKDNHIRAAGGIGEAVRRVRARGLAMPIEVEAQSDAQIDEAIAAGADVIMLDNLDLDTMRSAIARIGGRARVEISGRVTLDRLPALADLGADCASIGALTHSAPAVDISFELDDP